MAVEGKSWFRRRVESALVKGLTRAYSTVRVDPEKFLLQLRAAYRVPISGYHGVFSLDVRELDIVSESIIRSGMKLAALEGAGLGLGGLLTTVPDLGILSAITMRTIQKLSLLYGFEFNTDDEIVELWIAAASAAGVDVSREVIEKEVVNKFVPRIIQRIAASASTEVVEKWAGRVIPLASSAIGAGLNYWFVRAWGERARAHFRQRHLTIKQQVLQAERAEPTQPVLTGQAKLPSGPFPADFPAELSAGLFVHSGEAAWRPAQAIGAVEWLGEHGYAVLGTEVLRPEPHAIQSIPYFQNVDRKGNENWDSFVARAAAETIAHVRAVTEKLAEEGDVYINLTWVNEREFQNLKAI